MLGDKTLKTIAHELSKPNKENTSIGSNLRKSALS
nr:hypothetical protein [Cytobacillus firmus]